MPRDEYAAIMADETVRCLWCGLPVTNGQCLKCFPPSRPSRESMIRQAVLDALHEWYPINTEHYGPARTCHYVLTGLRLNIWFEHDVRLHYRRIVARYDLQEIAANGHE